MGKSAVRSKALFGLTATFVVTAMLQAAPASAGDTVYYYSSDTVHSEVVVTDQNRNVVERTYYAPYGQVLNRDLRDGPGYGGHEEDPETDLVYMQQRYYCPECGRFLSVDPVGVDPTSGGNFNRYEYANDNPYRYADPDGRDTKVSLMYYLIGSAPIQGDFGHQYVYMKDTNTGETVISRGGPSEPYRSGSIPLHAASNAAESSATGNGNITLRTTMTPASKSPDAGENSQIVPGSAVTLKENIGEAKATLSSFNKAVDSANISYKPQSTNSNAYAGTAYNVLTSKPAPSEHVLPGSNVNLKPQIPACTSTPKVCGGGH